MPALRTVYEREADIPEALRQYYEMKDGKLQVPQGSGLGVTLDEAAIEPHIVDRQVITRAR